MTRTIATALEPKATVIYTLPRPGRPGTTNGQPAPSDPDWQRLWAELHVMSLEKRHQLSSANLRELDIHHGSVITTVQTTAGSLDVMARVVVPYLLRDATICAVDVRGRIAAVEVLTADGMDTIYVDDPHPGAY